MLGRQPLGKGAVELLATGKSGFLQIGGSLGAGVALERGAELVNDAAAEENAGAGMAGDGRSAGTGAYFARTSRYRLLSGPSKFVRLSSALTNSFSFHADPKASARKSVLHGVEQPHFTRFCRP